MFNNTYNNNNGSTDNSVNTRLNTLFSQYSVLTIGGWGDKISIKLTPAVGVNADGRVQYDKNTKVQTAIGLMNAYALKQGIELFIMSALRDVKDEEKISVLIMSRQHGGQSRQTNLLSIHYVKDPDDNSAHIFLELDMNIDENGKSLPGNQYKYEFNNAILEIAHNTDNGDVGSNVVVPSEFNYFKDVIDNYIFMCSTMIPHAIKNEEATKFVPNNNGSNGYNNFNNQYSQTVDTSFLNIPSGSDAEELPFA